MKFVSTRDATAPCTASEAMVRGLASDGGLFVPERYPSRLIEEFDGLETLPEIGARLLQPFFEGDVLEGRMPQICSEAFDFDIPLEFVTEDTGVLELFHGPTAAFKDIGARFLASCLSRINEDADQPLTIMVATSGDTGGAVAAAFHGKPHTDVIILYPKGKVSYRQERQLTCWTGNVRTFAVRGVFDDCQKMVKSAFAHPWWQANRRLSSANSINIGRLLPQMVYYAASSLWYWRRRGVRPGFIVPSGNVGNACACAWAKACGMPIGTIVLATNDNRTVPEYMATGEFEARPTVQTLANAMDVGNPSNMERLRHMYDDDIELMSRDIRAFPVDDVAIRAQIRRGERVWGEVWCPHTACAVEIRDQLAETDQIIVATAHPAKFDVIVEPLIGHEIDVPAALAALLESENHAQDVDASLEALIDALTADERS